MGKFYGPIGFGTKVQTAPGVWEDVVTERNYYGDVTRNSRKLETTDKVNDNIDVTNTISIMADPFAYQNFFAMLYIKWYGSLWKVTSVAVKTPRLELTIGGVYNGITPESSGDSGGAAGE